MVQGSPDDFCDMQTKSQPMRSFLGLGDPINLPWQSHPGMPKAVQNMKEHLASLLPEWPVSKIEELNTSLLRAASSKEAYENLYTLKERVILRNHMRPARSLDEFDSTDILDRAMFGERSPFNYGFIRESRRWSSTQQEQLETDSSKSDQTQKPMKLRLRSLMPVRSDVDGATGIKGVVL